MAIAKHVWKLVDVVVGLFREAVAAEDQESASYYARELYRVGEVFFGPPSRPQSADLAQKVREKKEAIKSGRKLDLDTPFSEKEKRMVEIMFLSETPPANREALLLAFCPDEIAALRENDQPRRTALLGRTLQVLGMALMRLRRLIRTQSPHPPDQELWDCFCNRYPDRSLNQFEQLARTIFQRYEANLPKLWEKAGSRGRLPGTVTHRVKSTPPSDARPDWLQFLYAAFFHPDGADLAPAVLAERLQLAPESAVAILAGSIEALKLYWNGQKQDDRQVEEFVRMLKEQWPEKSLDEICLECTTGLR